MRDLYRATRASLADPWQPPQLIAELSSPGNDESLFYVPGGDDLVVVFGSERAGKRDLYTARRAAVGAPFDPPVPLAVDTVEFEETDPWLSPDGRTLYFATNRTGNSEIAVTTR
jgi:Tol biopolymer transport system component